MDEKVNTGRAITDLVFVWVIPVHIAPLNLDPHTKNLLNFWHVLDFFLSLLQELYRVEDMMIICQSNQFFTFSVSWSSKILTANC